MTNFVGGYSYNAQCPQCGLYGAHACAPVSYTSIYPPYYDPRVPALEIRLSALEAQVAALAAEKARALAADVMDGLADIAARAADGQITASQRDAEVDALTERYFPARASA